MILSINSLGAIIPSSTQGLINSERVKLSMPVGVEITANEIMNATNLLGGSVYRSLSELIMRNIVSVVSGNGHTNSPRVYVRNE